MLSARTRRLPVIGAALVAFGRNASAETPPSSVAPQERRAEFGADRVVLSPKDDSIDLDGHVVVSVDRYRLTSDHVALSRGPRGIEVRGAGRVAMCPCPDPPVTFGYQSATVAPPTDLLLESPTVRVGGVPVLWLPYLWLRSPARLGLLPLRVGYSGADGAFVGSGVHVPMGGAAVDLGAGGYTRGGAEVNGRVSTTRTSTDVRWDYLHEASLHLDARGFVPRAGGGSVAWDVDASRGARALSGPGALEEVALREDRARVFAGAVTDGARAIVGFVPAAVSARGGSIGVVDAVGPGAYAGFGAAIGQSASFDGHVSTATFARRDGLATTLAGGQLELRGEALAGPVVLSGEARSRGVATIEDPDVGHVVIVGGGGEASLPFVKTFGDSGTWQHWVTPFATASIGAAHSTPASVVPPLAENGVFYVASSGVRTTVGDVTGRRSAMTVSGRGGAMHEHGGAARGIAAWSAVSGTPVVAIGAEGVSTLGAREHGGDVVVARARFGRHDSFFVGGSIAGERGDVPTLSRLFSQGWDAPLAPYFARSGWTTSGSVGVPWTSWLGSLATVDYDLTHDKLLAVRGALAYRHPCGCLAVTLWGGSRLGRGATGQAQTEPPSQTADVGETRTIDAFISVDLATR